MRPLQLANCNESAKPSALTSAVLAVPAAAAGDIIVNGLPKQQSTWARQVGYVEQMVSAAMWCGFGLLLTCLQRYVLHTSPVGMSTFGCLLHTLLFMILIRLSLEVYLQIARHTLTLTC